MPYIGRGLGPTGAFRILDDVSGSFNGSTTTFALTVASTALTVGLPETLIIAVDGVIQEPGSAYTISGSNIVFGSAPQEAATFWGVELGDVGGIAQQAVTQSANDNTTNIATTAYVQTELGDYAPLANPTLTGTPAGPTANANTNTTQLATTAYVQTELTAYAADTVTLTNKTFDVEATGNSVSNIDVANLKSGVLDTDLTSASSSDDTVASAKAIKTALDLKATLASPVFTASIKITAASAPGSPTEGTIYYNTTSKAAYIWNGTAWSPLNAGISLDASGGTINNSVSGYRYHIFTSVGNTTFTPSIAGNIDYLVVAGGGAGGDSNSNSGGGGGAGGFRTGTGLAVTAQAYTVTVGGGGTVATNDVGGSGGNSVFSTITSAGGGGGGAQSVTIAGVAGGSGGGGTYENGAGGAGNTPSTSPVQGYRGGNVDDDSAGNAAAGGGGGASAAGGDASQATTGGGVGNGGAGENNIMGMNDADSYSHLTTLSLGHVVSGARYFAGGGAGEAYTNGAGTGGAGGGGNAATAGTANTGGGGGGGSNGGTNRTAAAGGTGIVIIRYAV